MPQERAAGDALDTIEMQTLLLIRNFEMLRRRSDLYEELDRAAYLLLRSLEKVGEADIATLAATIGVDPSTAGRQISTLTEDGLVERVAAPDDRRRTVVRPTEEGLRRMRALLARRRALTAELLTEWSEDDRAVLAEMFSRFNRTVIDHYLSSPADRAIRFR